MAASSVLALAAATVLMTTTTASARGGGGGSGFGGGGTRFGGGGGTRFGGGGGFFFLGGNGVGLLVLLALVVAYVLIRNWSQSRHDKRTSNTTTDRRAHRADGQAEERAAAVEAQVDVLADTDVSFDPGALRSRATQLYVTAQRAWTAGDLATLERILAPVVYGKWAEQLSGYAARGQSTVVEVLEGPDVQIVNVANRPGETEDTVTFRIVATLRDHVVDRRTGEVLTRKDRSTRPIEYWTLRKDGSGGWIVAGIEQAEDGHHHLTDALETDAWNQKSVGRDAVLEVAERTSPVRTADVLGLTNVSWADDADHAAADLSLVDARFDRSVLEVGIARFLEEWAMNDGSLDFTAVRTAHRTVMRTATVRSIAVRDLVSQDPVEFRVAVEADGIYYEVDRWTEAVVAGDPRTQRSLELLFTMRLDDASRGWTVTAVEGVG
ncbi:Predicted lipid-binding transport protein, Tim44 family [Nocardioides scoriae]|uniref:Predicted lipid-binding transport protein, Tim44 family n=1 Tax=Nocardioides scoriae TaxID=642780 RepID=A0A1H1TL27_9ACTN|nr:Tim44-like domain-containing protein [Nocardioides scoriae]SDS60953.1 Predicted lipid-binding transport protein, Tim44 family [Nocardioides scoriae]